MIGGQESAPLRKFASGENPERLPFMKTALQDSRTNALMGAAGVSLLLLAVMIAALLG